MFIRHGSYNVDEYISACNMNLLGINTSFKMM